MILADASHLRAEMHRREVHRDSVRLKHTDQLVCDLHPDAFLDRESAGEHPHEARELGDADYLFVRDLADIRMPVERKNVVLAE